MAKILLRQDDVNPHRLDPPEQTHLCFAAMKEHEEATKMVLRRDDANPDNLGQYEKTPLCYGTQNGYKGVAKNIRQTERHQLC